jgi:MFS transporter, DHA2 family, multidrug resistance protein
VPANDAFVHAMHFTSLVAALLALAGGFVVVRWMPGKPKAAPASDRQYEAELAILERDMLENAEPEV